MAQDGEPRSRIQRDEEFRYVVDELRDPEKLPVTLRALGQEPLADERIVQHLTKLLADTTPCVVALPYRYGEVRWLAAYALDAEYRALGIGEVISLPDVVRPLTHDQLGALAREAGILKPGEPGGISARFEKLRALGKLPVYDLVLAR